MPRPSFHDLFVHAGLEPPPLTLKMVKKAVLAFHKKYGKCPKANSGDATEIFGFHIFWKKVDNQLRNGTRFLRGGSSLSRLCIEMGLKKKNVKMRHKKRNVNITSTLIQEAAVAYYKEMGKTPNQKSGSAKPWIGLDITWSAINQALMKGTWGLSKGSSLFAVCIDLGLISNRGISKEEVEQAALAYHKKTGHFPTVTSGDASEWFNMPKGSLTWGSINKALLGGHRGLPGGTSLAEIKVKLKNTAVKKPPVDRCLNCLAVSPPQ